MSEHASKPRFVHVVLRVPDNAGDGDAVEAIDCLIGHALDGHGMRCASTREFAEMLMEEGGIQAMLEQLQAVEERHEMKQSIVKVRSKAQMDNDPFGMLDLNLNPSKDEVLH